MARCVKALVVALALSAIASTCLMVAVVAHPGQSSVAARGSVAVPGSMQHHMRARAPTVAGSLRGGHSARAASGSPSVAALVGSQLRSMLYNADRLRRLVMESLSSLAATDLKVVAPSAGQEVLVGGPVSITWVSVGAVDTVTIDLCVDTACSLLAAGANGPAGSFTWNVPDAQTPGDSYHIRIKVDNAPNVTSDGPVFSIVVPSSGSGYGPYLGVGFAGLVLLGLVVVYYFHKKRNGKARRRRTRLELAHTRQRERLLNEYERRFNLLLPRCSTPFTGGTMVCGENKWTYTPGPSSATNPPGVLRCVSGPYSGMQFWWMGSNQTGTVELRPTDDDTSLGWCDWDGDVLRWHSPCRVRRRGNGYIWRYETSQDLSHFMLHGRRRGVSFADETIPDLDNPMALFPRLWAMEVGTTTVLAPKRPTDQFMPVGVEGSVPPVLALCVALMPAALQELRVQQELYKTQVAGERKEEAVRRRQRALRLFGRVAFVSRFPDVKVQLVNDDADMDVQIVKGYTPDQPCMWQVVPANSNPDYCVQLVKKNPDFTVKYVKSFPRVNIEDEGDSPQP